MALHLYARPSLSTTNRLHRSRTSGKVYAQLYLSLFINRAQPSYQSGFIDRSDLIQKY